MHRARHIIIISYILSDITTTIHHSISKLNLILNFGPLVSKDHILYHENHVDCGSLNTLGGEPLFSGTASTQLAQNL
jgi:hypothetical protein